MEKKLKKKKNLYKIWNRMSSGSYLPPPVRTVKIPKPNGGERKLGIPTVSDRIAQQVVKSRMEAVRKHAQDRWIVLYIQRWLKASVQEEDGRLVPREKGTPQGGVISPLLANLFLHYGLDRWLQANYPKVVFERFADDVIVHCRTEGEALVMQKAIAERLQNCGLELHPEKTKIVYCKDDDRRRTYPNEKFDFLGYTFRPRRSKNRKGKHFINFSPAVQTNRHRPCGIRFGAGICQSAVIRRSTISPTCSGSQLNLRRGQAGRSGAAPH